MQEYRAQLGVSDDELRKSVRVPAGMLLHEVSETFDLTTVRYLLVEDERGGLQGIVESADIVRRLSSWNQTEQRRWAETPLEAIVMVRFDETAAGPVLDRDEDGQAILEATAIACESRMVALNLGDDVLIRWSSVKDVLQNALFDPVTSLPNRAVFDRRLSEEWARVRRKQSSIAVLMIDLDHFKQINDENGHLTGDQVLREVAETLTHQLRSYDLLTRYGGDEFAAILTDCYTTDIHIPVSRLQAGVDRLARTYDFGTPDLTISVGAITCPGSHGLEPSQLVNAADECLYAAKRAGRGCAFTLDLALSGSAKPRPLATNKSIATLPFGTPRRPR